MVDSIPRPFVCPSCHGVLSGERESLFCGDCKNNFSTVGGIRDFSLHGYYDSFDPEQDLPPENLIGLKNEEDGIRTRIKDYYLPIIRSAYGNNRVRILDCGCGNGLSVDLLRQAGLDAWGNDLSQLRKWQWREREHRDYLFVADGAKLPVESGFFDVVICSGVLEHIGVTETGGKNYTVRPEADRHTKRIAFLNELLRVTDASGQVFLDFPNGRFPIDFWHGSTAGGIRFHGLFEGFLPSVSEIRRYTKQLTHRPRLVVMSPHRRLRFQQVGRHWYGRFLRFPAELFMKATSLFPLRWLAASPVNPYLVLQLKKN